MMASISKKQDFKGFSQIESLYSEGVLLKLGLQDDLIKKLQLPNLVTRLHESSQGGGLLKYDTPKILSKDRLSWLHDDEFARQALAGVNPVSIEKLKVFPPVSQLDPEIYGTLKPIAIELSLPRALPGSQPKRVLTPPIDATSNWTWQLAKAHVCSNDARVHQLSHHWLRTHAAMEPFITSLMLIRYCMEISVVAYKHWRFDLEGLPVDLIRRGMAVPDPSQRHGIKLLIEDYPYASDGLLIWEAIQNWVQTYVTRYYPDPSLVCNDRELQASYAEVINVGHADLRHKNWWPTLANAEDLTAILTTIIWLTSAQHAALNFGQYTYGGYIPNRPPRMRRLIPYENDPEYASFLEDPQNYFLLALPSMLQSKKYMAVADTLSTHSPDEEYIGERQQRDTWSGEAEMVEAFYRFASEIQRIEKEIEK
ncbi:linoleate 13S-lipoxygenase 3-1, chloroplastic, partial [Tanacetum coccineum]